MRRNSNRQYAKSTDIPSHRKQGRQPFDVALDYLALRDRSEREIREYLRRKKYTDSEIEETIEKLKSYGYLNDEKFARSFAASRFSSGRSSLFIRRELIKKGISPDLISRAIKDTKPDLPGEINIAAQLVSKKYRPTLPLTPELKNRIISFLARRGYEWEIIRKVLFRLGEEIPEE